MGDADVLSQLAEVAPFLAPSQRKDVRAMALGLATSFTSSPELAVLLVRLGAAGHMVQMLCCDDEKLACDAAKALVNITADDKARTMIAADTFVVERCMDLLKDGSMASRHRLAVSLVGNLSQDAEAAKRLLQVGTALQGLNILRLLQLFVKGDDVYDNVAHVLTNVSNIEYGRRLMCDPKRGILPHLVRQVTCGRDVRRLGALRTLRNCAFEQDVHEELLREDIGVLSSLLLLLTGAEPMDDDDKEGMLPAVKASLHIDKHRDASKEVRRLALETIDLLVRNKSSRRYLKKVKVYPVLRALHLWEDDADTLEYIEDLVQWFITDEEAEITTTEEAG